MIIEFQKVKTRKKRQLITDAVELFTTTLLHPRTIDILEISIVECDLGHADGYCSWQDTNINPREFTIELDKKLSENFQFCWTQGPKAGPTKQCSCL